MSGKEKALVAKIAAMPGFLQEKFLDKADGAIMAIEAMRKQHTGGKETDNGEKSDDAGRAGSSSG